jgi:hypothetical protein
MAAGRTAEVKPMANMDRRSGRERRVHPRIPVTIEIEWAGKGARLNGTISDISVTGCFVLSGGDITDGESIKLFFPLGDGMKAEFEGVVVNHVFEIGFGVRFSPLSIAQKRLIENAISVAQG